MYEVTKVGCFVRRDLGLCENAIFYDSYDGVALIGEVGP